MQSIPPKCVTKPELRYEGTRMRMARRWGWICSLAFEEHMILEILRLRYGRQNSLHCAQNDSVFLDAARISGARAGGCSPSVSAAAPLLKMGFDDGEVVVELGGAAEVADVGEEVVHEAFSALADSAEVGDAGGEVPGGAAVAADFEDAVAQNDEARAGRDGR